MPVELKVPAVGESITEVQIAQWWKQVGERAEKDENLVEIESDKATVELPAPVSGTLTQILKQPGDTAAVGEVIGYMVESAAVTSGANSSPPVADGKQATPAPRVMPSAERILAQENIPAAAVTPTGPGGRVLKEDAQRAAERVSKPSPPGRGQSEGAGSALDTLTPTLSPKERDQTKPSPAEIVSSDLARRRDSSSSEIATGYPREEEFVVMSPIRRRIAERLVAAQQQAALLTTYNEVDMGEVIALRMKHRDQYEKHYGVKLGFMSFFVKAVVDALKAVPQLNAEVREPHVVYRNYYDIGIAVGGGKGLVVPVLRNAEFMSFAEIEQKIADFARRAAENKIKLDELQGGTFTISNGGVYGSMLSMPIVNPPQTGILGLHAIQDRPVARQGEVVIRPIMYLALTYDHRIVDGREAVMFLKRIKEVIEEPSRMLLEI
jgi:2-oxoglutarate dehydrogenase E2 component (dihydrolipoamide succinyltransferase)